MLTPLVIQTHNTIQDGETSCLTTEAICDKMPTNSLTSANGAQTAITMSWSTPENGQQPDHYFESLPTYYRSCKVEQPSRFINFKN